MADKKTYTVTRLTKQREFTDRSAAVAHMNLLRRADKTAALYAVEVDYEHVPCECCGMVFMPDITERKPTHDQRKRHKANLDNAVERHRVFNEKYGKKYQPEDV